jgi:NAD(P)-dependent dehydrogenase (short-subunit alcohol dehydrogenase family)
MPMLNGNVLTFVQAYSVTKAAQIHLVKSLALIAGPIRVNSVSPGVLMTVRIFIPDFNHILLTFLKGLGQAVPDVQN